MYSGKALKVEMLPSGAANLVFDLDGSSVNKFNQATLKELQEVVAVLQGSNVSGLIVSSAKPAFIVGADITEFTAMFSEPEDVILSWLQNLIKFLMT